MTVYLTKRQCVSTYSDDADCHRQFCISSPQQLQHEQMINRMNVQGGTKSKALSFIKLLFLHQILTHLQTSFSVMHTVKEICNKAIIIIPPYLRHVAMPPCEMLMKLLL